MTTPTRASSAVRAAGESAVFHPERLVAVLGRFKVRYVLVGGVAARLQGFPWMTALAELAPAIDPANFEALATALKHLNARIYTDGTPEGLSFAVSADALAGAEQWRFITSCGRLDVSFRSPGTSGFGELSARAVRFVLHGDEILAANLDDLLRMREATGTRQDRYEIALLREMVKRQATGQRP